MKHFFLTASAAVALAGLALAPSAQANNLKADFSGTVQSSTGNGFAVNDAVSGSFVLDTSTGQFRHFVVGGEAIQAGFGSTAALTPDRFTALYQAQWSAATGAALNSSFVLDLEGIAPWTGASASALLADLAQLAANTDLNLSNFGFYNADAAGSNVRSLNAQLSSLTVTSVPEPGSLLLVALAASALLTQRGLRRRG